MAFRVDLDLIVPVWFPRPTMGQSEPRILRRLSHEFGRGRWRLLWWEMNMRDRSEALTGA
jgi:hypothetical protein